MTAETCGYYGERDHLTTVDTRQAHTFVSTHLNQYGGNMRKITGEAVDAFLSGRNYKKDNTEVVVQGNKVTMLLHDNKIAMVGAFDSHPELRITTGGWDTNTTKERLNGLPGVQVNHSDHKLYLNGKKWDGEWTTV
jgi:hypothetical protein